MIRSAVFDGASAVGCGSAWKSHHMDAHGAEVAVIVWYFPDPEASTQSS